MNQKAIANYLKIVEGKTKPRFKRLGKERLGKKIAEAFNIINRCELCERKCKVNRLKGQLGWCEVPAKLIVTSMFDHYGEEQFLVPSFTIFFWSCIFSCQYCQNWTVSQRFEKGTEVTEEQLAKIIDSHSYCKNVNFVGGEPTMYLPFILKTLKFVKGNIPVVWNSNFYMSKKSMQLLKDVIDIYLSDWKYGNNKCAERLSKVNGYWEIISRNHLLAFKDSELVIRHLLLPNHFDCCTKPILKFIAKNFGDKVIINIMEQYHPEYKASNYPEINRMITREELEKAVKLAEKLGLNFIT